MINNKNEMMGGLARYYPTSWIDVKDMLPTNDSMCIVYRNRLKVVDYAYYDNRFEFPYSNVGLEEGEYIDVTHWIPLPAPPRQVDFHVITDTKYGKIVY